ncbi:hypothetical protein [Kocuria sp.]|uniref:hypothetical protein n=1 Tax=Kocuria sp. TaxID=1871328 RepID=UPI0026DFE674|nr:hypothetical protein [Kocuria sp.]MDO5619395.1 hypothetical protein [Kocuria sp.]
MSQDRFLDHGEPSPDDIRVPDVVDFESNTLDLPAPVIDLGGTTASPDADKPLGPRRLALLREQMEQHVRELAENQSEDPEYVDEDLAQKQRRIAELSSRAALSSQEDRQAAERAMAAGLVDPDDAQPHTASIPADQVRRRDLREPDEAPEQPQVTEDAEVPASDVAEDQPEAISEDRPEATPEDQPEVIAEDQPEAITESPDEPAHPAPETAEDDVASPAGEEAPDSESVADGSAEAEPASATETVEEPAQPVSALDAQGLELLDPAEYRQSSHVKTFLLVLAAVVLLAVAVTVLMILL